MTAAPKETLEEMLLLPENFQNQGIVTHDFCSSAAGRVGQREYFCKLCGCGPFHDKQSVETHIFGRRHAEEAKKWGYPPLQPAEAQIAKLSQDSEESTSPASAISAADMLRREMASAGLCLPTAPDLEILDDYGGRTAAEIFREEMARAKLCSCAFASAEPSQSFERAGMDEASLCGAAHILHGILKELREPKRTQRSVKLNARTWLAGSTL